MLPIVPNTSLLPQFPKEIQSTLLKLLKCDGMISTMLQVSKGDNEVTLMEWNCWLINLDKGVPDDFTGRFSLLLNPLPLALAIRGANCLNFGTLINHLSLANREIRLWFNPDLGGAPDIDLLTKMTNLALLSLPGCGLNSSDAASLGKLTKLKTLNINSNSLADSGVKVITTTLTNLTDLQIFDNSMSERGIGYLTCLTNLRKLEFSKYLLPFEGTEIFKLKNSLPSLTGLKESTDEDGFQKFFDERLSEWQGRASSSESGRKRVADEIRATLNEGKTILVIFGENCTTLPPIPPEITELVLINFSNLQNQPDLSVAKQLVSLKLINSVTPCLMGLSNLRTLTLDCAALSRPCHLALPKLRSLIIDGKPDVNSYIFVPAGLSGLETLSVQTSHPAIILPCDLFLLIEEGKVIVSDSGFLNGLDKFFDSLQIESYANTMFKFANGERSKTKPDDVFLAFFYKEAAKAGHKQALFESRMYAALDKPNPEPGMYADPDETNRKLIQAQCGMLSELANLEKRDAAQTRWLETFLNKLVPFFVNRPFLITPEQTYIMGKAYDALSDEESALYYHKEAAHMGHSEAAFRVGMMYKKYTETNKPWDLLGLFKNPEDRSNAIKYFEMAGEAHQEAKKELHELQGTK